MPARRFSLIVAIALLLSVGCEETLETGYQPRTLKASEADRRAYYAQPFSPGSQPENKGTGFNFTP